MNLATAAEVTTHGLEMIAEIVKLLADVHAEKVPPDEALGKIAEFHDRLMADRSAADRARAEKFPTGSAK